MASIGSTGSIPITFQDLPFEVIVEIFEYIRDLGTLRALICTSKPIRATWGPLSCKVVWDPTNNAKISTLTLACREEQPASQLLTRIQAIAYLHVAFRIQAKRCFVRVQELCPISHNHLIPEKTRDTLVQNGWAEIPNRDFSKAPASHRFVMRQAFFCAAKEGTIKEQEAAALQEIEEGKTPEAFRQVDEAVTSLGLLPNDIPKECRLFESMAARLKQGIEFILPACDITHGAPWDSSKDNEPTETTEVNLAE